MQGLIGRFINRYLPQLVQRHFWVIGAFTVMVCAVFAAKATAHVVEAKVLPDSARAPAVPVAMPSPSSPVKLARSKDGGPLAGRNMFCSSCTPPVTVAVNPGSIQTTTLPLVLVATNVGATPDGSYATIIDSTSGRQGSFSIGDPIPGATGKLKEIHYKYIDFDNQGHIERLVLQGQAPPPASPPPQPEVADGDDLQSQIDNGIKSTGDNQFEIDKALVDKIVQNPMAVAKGARVIPAMQNGKPMGFKLYAIRPGSVFAKLGLANGDTLESINGFVLDSAEKALEVYTKLREATSLEVDIQRRGKPVTLKYTIR